MQQKKKTILIAPNSFKECADSIKIANLIEQNLKKLSESTLIKRPISDGGDGFLEVCKNNYDLKIIKYEISTPYNNSKMLCKVGYDNKNRSIYIESADVLGLKIIPKSKRHPGKLSSKGLGDLLFQLKIDVENNKIIIDNVVIGIGGTGTNDLGLGSCSQFGLKITDASNRRLNIIPENFSKINNIKWDKITLPFKIKVITDVDNPLLGKLGATRTFGKQKGLSDIEINSLENSFNKIIKILKNKKLYNLPKILSGAGGGLAAGLQIFFNAEVTQSYNFISEIIKKSKLDSIDAVVTGEGVFDNQSLMKKATGSILEIFKGENVPIFLCCGKIDAESIKSLDKNVKTIELIDYFKNDKEAIKQYKKGIKLACYEIAKLLEN